MDRNGLIVWKGEGKSRNSYHKIRMAEENKIPSNPDDGAEDDMGDRLERLGGEPAPVITPEEFARLQKAGQVHIDSRGRVRTASRSGPNAGVSLRKRRAWYSH